MSEHEHVCDPANKDCADNLFYSDPKNLVSTGPMQRRQKPTAAARAYKQRQKHREMKRRGKR